VAHAGIDHLGSAGGRPADTGSSVTPDYDPPFRFDGRIHRVIVDVSGDGTLDTSRVDPANVYEPSEAKVGEA
jgi:hypothetical protein